ncbi:MAG: response regulator [Candidatus Methylacidiphilales bacterium]|nr:response regulator [Candidatus Methylacidiphilales bacterium]
MKILIVEDDPVSRKMLEAALLREGHEVIVANDGRSAWALFDADPVRVVVSDWVMPEMDGLELCAKIRQRPKTPYTYFILLSAKDASRENVRRAMIEGVDDFLSKPLNPEAIWARLHVAGRILHYTSEIRQLQELLPICMYCKKIREDASYWKQIEQYISERTGSGFSHGICPDCYEKVVLPQLQPRGEGGGHGTSV